MVEEQKVRDGYQETEVGVYPEDWELARLGSVTTKIGSGVTPTGGSRVYKKSGRPFVRSQNVRVGKMELNDIVFIDEDTHSRFKGTEIEENDVLLNITGASIGRSSVADEFVVGGNVNQHVCILRPVKDMINPYYLCSYISSSKGQKYIDEFQAGGNRQGLNFSQIASIKIPLPEFKEQKTIATALTDADTLLQSLQKLVEKKKKIKEGAMQEILTGKKRLNGFTGNWKKIVLGHSSSIKARIGWQGLTTNEYLGEGDYYLITGTDFFGGKIKWKTCNYVDFSRFTQDKNIQLREHDVLVTKDGTIGKVAYIDSLPKDSTLNSGVFVVRPINCSYDSKFLYWILSSTVFTEFLDKLTAGSTISHLYQKDFIGFEFLTPPTIEEQQAIARILSDIDTEIEALEQKYLKLIDFKKGMMQELLTGRVRLV